MWEIKIGDCKTRFIPSSVICRRLVGFNINVTSGGVMCKNQTAVSHSSVESEIISLDAGLRMDSLPALQLWECVLETLSSKSAKGNLESQKRHGVIPSHSHSDFLCI